VTDEHARVSEFSRMEECESIVILRKRSPSLREGLPTKDLCIDGRRWCPMPGRLNGSEEYIDPSLAFVPLRATKDCAQDDKGWRAGYLVEISGIFHASN
jgi:hypothetical protein